MGMTISLDEINRVTLRQTFLPWFRRTCEEVGFILPADWDPSDAELERLATRMGKAFGEELEEVL